VLASGANSARGRCHSKAEAEAVQLVSIKFHLKELYQERKYLLRPMDRDTFPDLLFDSWAFFVLYYQALVFSSPMEGPVALRLQGRSPFKEGADMVLKGATLLGMD